MAAAAASFGYRISYICVAIIHIGRRQPIMVIVERRAIDISIIYIYEDIHLWTDIMVLV